MNAITKKILVRTKVADDATRASLLVESRKNFGSLIVIL